MRDLPGLVGKSLFLKQAKIFSQLVSYAYKSIVGAGSDSVSTFFRGALLLVIASFLGECIEFLINMVLAKELGEKGMGMYMTILPTIFLIVLLASFELPISISKFISEKDEKYHKNMLGHATRFTIVFISVLLVIAAFVVPNMSVFNEYHPLLKWIILLFIPLFAFSAIARGYFMGKHQMGKIAFSHFLRRLLQLLVLVVLYQLFQFDMDTALLIAFCSLAASEFVVFLYLIHMLILQYRQLTPTSGKTMTGKEVRKNLMAVSIPTTALRIFHSMTHAVQPFLIKAALVHAGFSSDLATEQFGMLAGVAMTIGFFPAFIAHSLLIVLIPTVSRAYSKNQFFRLKQLLRQVMMITFGYGVPAVIICYIFAEPLTNLFFHSSSAAAYLQMLWPYFLFHFFVIPMQAYLIGLGLIKDAFIHTVWATAISFLLIYLLGSMYQLQMGGVIIGMNTGSVLLTLMHYLTICKKIGVTWNLRIPVRKTI